MDYQYVAKAQQTLDALNDAVKVLEYAERGRADVQLYNYTLTELNRARSGGQLTYVKLSGEFGAGRGFKTSDKP